LRQTLVRRCQGGLGSPRPAANRQIRRHDQTLVRRCHGGWGSSRSCPESANQAHDGGASVGEVFAGAAKAKRRPPHWAGRFAPSLRFVMPRQTFVHGSHGGALPGGRDEPKKTSSTLV